MERGYAVHLLVCTNNYLFENVESLKSAYFWNDPPLAHVDVITKHTLWTLGFIPSPADCISFRFLCIDFYDHEIFMSGMFFVGPMRGCVIMVHG